MSDLLEVELIPARADNYIYLIFDPITKTSGVVDPADFEPVHEALMTRKRGLDWIINTHHHDDHTAGNHELKSQYGARLAAPLADQHRMTEVDQWLTEGDRLAFGSQVAKIIATPGHTSGHISLWFDRAEILFSGDTLFALGCGRIFEGTPQQMWASLSKYDQMPDQTTVYCGHEYTLSNAKFALSVDPDNQVLLDRVAAITEARRQDRPTIPTQLGIERATNPFLRPSNPEIRAKIGLESASDIEVFTEIRRLKDHF